ncbi:MAG: hypothetical protein ACYSX0_08685 [Planctomycetota bacterium]|jgi:hypothetical protein
MSAAAILVCGPLLAACGGPDPELRRAELAERYRAGVAQARREIAEGRAVLYVDHLDSRTTLRIDQEAGLPLRSASAHCGTDVDGEALNAVISGYRSEVARALGAGELEGQSLRHKIPEESGLRDRFVAERATVLDTPNGGIATPGGFQVRWRTAKQRPTVVAFDLVDPETGDRRPLPFNRRPLRVLWDHDGTTLVAMGPDGSLATMDIPSMTWIAVFPGPSGSR